MTFLAILIAIGTGWLWFATEGPVISGPLTVYVFAFIVGLGFATLFAIRSKDRRNILGAGVLILNFVGSHIAWQTDNPILFSGVLDLLTAAYFVIGGATRWELTIGGLYLASVLTGFLTAMGAIPSHFERPYVYLAFSYPDLASAIGHIANATLGFASGDSGYRLRDILKRRPAFLGKAVNLLAVLRQRSTG